MLIISGLPGPAVYKTKAIAEVYCNTEEGVLLEEYVMPWIENDLQRVKSLQLVARPTNVSNKIECNWHSIFSGEPDQEQTSIDTLLPKPVLLLSSDLAFGACVLGKEGVASHYCPCCMLTKTKWTESPDKRPAGFPWTLQRLEEMFYDMYY